MTAAYKERHDYVVRALNDIEGFECRPGEGTFYALPRVVGALDSMNLDSDTDFAASLINDANVACVPGSAFGAPGYIRLSFACSMETLKEAMNRIKRVVST